MLNETMELFGSELMLRWAYEEALDRPKSKQSDALEAHFGLHFRILGYPKLITHGIIL